MRFLILTALLFFGLTGFSQYAPYSNGIIKHRYYSLDYNIAHKQANWVYYLLDLRDKVSGVERTNRFRTDPEIYSGSATSSDYTGSGYDRGHLCPAADMAFSPVAMDETFYMSNISPQVPAFNRGIWKRLEEKVRQWAKQEKIYVVTGPVFKENKGSIGRKITVPGYYYKIVYSPGKQQMIAFLLPNGKAETDLYSFVVPVDSIETVTGIDFFPQLPDTLQMRLEAHSDCKRW